MSILIALRLTEDSGLFAADRAYSYRGRAVKYEDKIFSHGRFLLGFSGDLALRDPVLKSLRGGQPQDMDSAVKSVEDAYSIERDIIFYRGPLRTLGYAEVDWKHRGKDQQTLDKEKADAQGQLAALQGQTDPTSLEMIRLLEMRLAETPKQILPQHLGILESAYQNGFFDGRPITEGNFIVAGLNTRTSTFEIYGVDFPGSAQDAGYFHVIGPFASRDTVHVVSRSIIGSTLDVESLHGRPISESEGARIALSVVREGWAERGIGGKTQLMGIKGDKIIRYTLEQTTYMHNLLELERGRTTLDREQVKQHVRDSINQVMTDPDKFNERVSDTVSFILGSTAPERGKRFLAHQLRHKITLAEEIARDSHSSETF